MSQYRLLLLVTSIELLVPRYVRTKYSIRLTFMGQSFDFTIRPKWASDSVGVMTIPRMFYLFTDSEIDL
jgi:hypothetical protein